jgi:hypothetical protein
LRRGFGSLARPDRSLGPFRAENSLVEVGNRVERLQSRSVSLRTDANSSMGHAMNTAKSSSFVGNAKMTRRSLMYSSSAFPGTSLR